MNKKSLNVVLQGIINLLFVFGFFMPINKVTGFISLDVSIIDQDTGWIFLVAFILVSGVFTFLTHYKPHEKRYTMLINLIAIYLLTIFFFIDSIGKVEESDFFVVTMGISPFYFLIIAVLFSIFHFANHKIVSTLLKNENQQHANNTSFDQRYEQLDKIKTLLDNGTITEDEYSEEKKRILKS